MPQGRARFRSVEERGFARFLQLLSGFARSNPYALKRRPEQRIDPAECLWPLLGRRKESVARMNRRGRTIASENCAT